MARLTRKELVYQLLHNFKNTWVDGPRIASPEVGGSEGLKRLRELRMDGSEIRMRKHPDPNRDIFQYMLVVPTKDRVDHISTPAMAAIEATFPLQRQGDGSIDVLWSLCADCGGRYLNKPAHDKADEHRSWLKGQILISDVVDVEEPTARSFITQPDRVAFGSAVPCPRCHGWRRRRKGILDDYSADPRFPNKECVRCHGFGVVPA